MGWEQADKFIERISEPPAPTKRSDPPVPFKDRSIRPGGLFRCCTETWSLTKDLTTKGSIVPCVHCKHAMIVANDGIVEWNEKWRSS